MLASEILLSALQESLQRGQIRSPEDIRQMHGPELTSEEFKQIVDLAVRQTFLKAETSDLPRILKLAFKAVEDGQTSANLPVQLVGDILSTRILKDCELLFDELVEGNTAVWKSELFYSTSKNVLLRSVNDLLKRASKLERTEFCGKIQLFLAKFYPVTEKSGLNLMSHFNSENVTVFEHKSGADQHPKLLKGPSGVLVDVALHRRFWSLQTFFSDPNQCLSNEGWKRFAGCSSEVLNVFASFRLTNSKHQSSSEHFTSPKYLTSERLLDMQLADPIIRRQVLVQFLILFDYLRGTVKFRPENLTPDRLKWVENARQQVRHLLRETPPDGEKFEENICRILSQDLNIWNRWKNEGCPSFIAKKKDLHLLESSGQAIPANIERDSKSDSELFDDSSEERPPTGTIVSADLYRRIQLATANNGVEELRKTCPLLDWQVLRLFRWRRPPRPALRNVPKIEEYLSAVYERIASESKTPPLKRPAATDDCEDDLEEEGVVKQ